MSGEIARAALEGAQVTVMPDGWPLRGKAEKIRVSMTKQTWNGMATLNRDVSADETPEQMDAAILQTVREMAENIKMPFPCKKCEDAEKAEQTAGKPEQTAKEREETPPAPEQQGKRDAGKIVDFPAPASPTPAPPADAVTEQEKDIEWAAMMLKTLRNYCETMAVVKGGQTVPWAEYAEAVDIALFALRK